MLNPQPEKTFIRNKAAQVFALLFVTEYLTKWPKFFFDILSVVDLNPRGVDMYLRILMAVDAELVDRDVVHTSEASYYFTLIFVLKSQKCLYFNYSRRHAERFFFFFFLWQLCLKVLRGFRSKSCMLFNAFYAFILIS